jgi:prenyltransferase beta subunit
MYGFPFLSGASANSIKLMGSSQLINQEAIRRFLLEQTQHRIGGFGKAPGNPPGTFYLFLVPQQSLIYMQIYIIHI